MKPLHNPRLLISLIIVLAGAIFLAGTLRSPVSVRAAPINMLAATANFRTENAANLTPTPEPTTVPTSVLVSADTTGIIVFAIVIVIIVLVSAFLGLSGPRKKRSS